MASKKTAIAEGRGARIKPDAAAAPEVAKEETAPEMAKEETAPEVSAPKVEAKKPKMIKVRATRGYMWDPIQLVGIKEGTSTLVIDNEWIGAQKDKGLLEEC